MRQKVVDCESTFIENFLNVNLTAGSQWQSFLLSVCFKLWSEFPVYQVGIKQHWLIIGC